MLIKRELERFASTKAAAFIAVAKSPPLSPPPELPPAAP